MSDRALGVACVVLSTVMVWAAQDYAAAISYEPIGPRAFPILLACCLGLCGLWLVVRPSAGLETFADVPWKQTGVCAAAILAYAALFQWLGFPIATALMSMPLGVAFGGSWKHSLTGGIALGLSLFVLFDKVLDIVMPAGPLASLFGVN